MQTQTHIAEQLLYHSESKISASAFYSWRNDYYCLTYDTEQSTLVFTKQTCSAKHANKLFFTRGINNCNFIKLCSRLQQVSYNQACQTFASTKVEETNYVVSDNTNHFITKYNRLSLIVTKTQPRRYIITLYRKTTFVMFSHYKN